MARRVLLGPDVLAIAAEYGLAPHSTAYGFELDSEWRLERGGGIAGNPHRWRVVHKRRPHRCSDPASTPPQLRRILREYLAGIDERPGDRAGYITYPKLNHNRFGDHWVWVQRRKQR